MAIVCISGANRRIVNVGGAKVYPQEVEEFLLRAQG